MGEKNLEYPTHTLILSQANNTKFIKAVNLVKDVVYQEMVDAFFEMQYFNLHFVTEERKLLNNFVKSLLSFHNTKENLSFGEPEMYSFIDEAEYYVFCIINDLPFAEQEWFKTIYIKATFLYSITLFQSASVSLVKTLYPEYYSKPVNLLEERFRLIELELERYKCPIDLHMKFLEDNNIINLYHFSSRKNLKSIKSNGLCSFNELEKLGLSIEYGSSESSRQIDASKNLSDYVHLSFERRNPMLFIALGEGRLNDYLIFEIAPEVIFLKDSKYSNINAASKDAIISSDINFFLNLPFNNFHNKDYNLLSNKDKKHYQAEVLVKNIIQTNLILNIDKYE